MEEVTATKSKNPGPDCAGTLILYSHQHYKASMIIIFISQMQKLTLGEVKGLVSRVPCGWVLLRDCKAIIICNKINDSLISSKANPHLNFSNYL